MIHTTIDEYNTRMGLRDTWLQYIKQNQVQNISYVFLIAKEKSGQVLYPLRKERIKNEQAKFNDILQVDDLVDHYNNLTLKSVFMLKFFLDKSNFYDPPPSHVMKVDSDVYLNLPQLVKLMEEPVLNKTDMYLIGSRFGTRKKPDKPIRVPKNKRKQKFTEKWWVPEYLYNGLRYPVKLSGSGYLTTRKAAECLYKESMKLPYFHLEDVFITGFAAENCGVARWHAHGFNPLSVFDFKKLSKDDILWHYFKTPSVIHMHKFLMYDDLMAKYQHLKEELIKYQHINEELEGF